MKKKQAILALLLVFTTSPILADDVSEEQALQTARTFVLARTSYATNTRKAPADIMPQLAFTVKSERLDKANVYVVNLGDDQGFVLVSGESNMPDAILGYCDHGSFCFDEAPCGLKAMLEQYAAAVDQQRKQPAKHSQTRADDSYGNLVVEPLVTTTWNQNAPFNDLCPMINGDTHTVTGCTTTAMVQIMAYWKYPRQGRGQHSYTYNPGVINTVTYSVDFSQSFYDWDNMLDNYDGEYTEEQGAAVALLMKDAGYALDSRWGYYPSGTLGGARSPEEALAMNFDYNPDSIRTIGMGDADFIEQLKRELDAGRPVFFTACVPFITWSSGNSHAMVVDGYTDDDFFHVNFGWSGEYDGYYQISYFYSGSAILGISPANSVNLDGLYFTTAEQTAALCYSDVEGVVDVPETITVDGQTYTVESIAKMALYESTKTTQVNLPGSIKSIGERAFYDCPNLTVLTAPKTDYGTSNSLPENLTTMGNYAFAFCKGLKNITLPSSLERVPDYAFYRCEGLEQVIIRSNTVGVMAFSHCNRDPNLRVSLWAEELCDSAFFYTGIKDMTFSNTKHIGTSSVGGLKSVFLDKIETIGDCILTAQDGTFTLGPNAPIKTLRFNSPFSGYEGQIIIDRDNPNFISVNNVIYNKDMTELLFCTHNCEMVNPNRSYTDSRMEMVVPESVERIQDFALVYAPLTKLTIPSSVQEIGVYNIHGDVNVYDYATTPQPIHLLSELSPLNPFRDGIDTYLSTPLTGTLHVPAGCKEAYAAAEVWKNFATIVDDLPSPNSQQPTPSVNGVCIATTHGGLYSYIMYNYEFLFSSHPKITYERVYDATGWAMESNTVISDDDMSLYVGDDFYQDGVIRLYGQGENYNVKQITFFYDNSGANEIKNVLDKDTPTVRFSMDSRSINVSGLNTLTPSPSTIMLYTLDGKTIASATATADGRAKLDIPAGQAVYILKVGEVTFKLRIKN